jgi:hypothetical protein
MAIKKIEKSEWQNYFDTFSKTFLRDIQPEYAEIQVLSSESGIQPKSGWLPLEGITYEPKKGTLNIMVENIDHLILHPVEIYVDDDKGWITSMEITQQDGTKEIIEIR